MLTDKQWGPWIEHFGHGMPVQTGTIVEVTTYEAVNPNKGEVIGWVGVAVTFNDCGRPEFSPTISEAARGELRWENPISLNEKHRARLLQHRLKTFV